MIWTTQNDTYILRSNSSRVLPSFESVLAADGSMNFLPPAIFILPFQFHFLKGERNSSSALPRKFSRSLNYTKFTSITHVGLLQRTLLLTFGFTRLPLFKRSKK